MITRPYLFGRITTTHMFLVIMLLALVLRVCFSLTNIYANDSHHKVVRIIQKHWRSPGKRACYQCYHPKLFYWTAAVVGTASKRIGLKRLLRRPWMSSIQLMNSIAGLLTLVALWVWFREIRIPPPVALLSLAYAAFLPRFVGINGEIANDSFAIFFSTIALIHMHLTIRDKSDRAFLIALIATFFANWSKNTALPVLVLMLLTTCYHCMRSSGPFIRRSLYICMIIFILLPAVFVFGGFFERMRSSGDPFTLNQGKRIVRPGIKTAKRLPLFRNSHARNAGREVLPSRDGGGFIHALESAGVYQPRRRHRETRTVRSWSSLLTFYPFSLISFPHYTVRSPILRLTGNTLPPHMTSVWTLIYARANSMRFDSVRGKYHYGRLNPLKNLARVIFTLGLIPLAITFISVWFAIQDSLVQLWKLKVRGFFNNPHCTEQLFFTIAFIGFFLFAALFNYFDRRVWASRIVYFLPGMIVYLYFFSTGMKHLLAQKLHLTSSITLGRLAYAATTLLILCYVVEVWSVISLLARRTWW